MHPLLDVRPWPKVLLRYPLLILTALLLGGLAAFAYSYAPLHAAKDWKIDYLEERLEVRNQQVRELEESLAAARASLEGTPSNDEIGALRTQLKEATQLADSREREVASLQKKLDSTAKSRDQWKSRHAAVVAEMESHEKQAAAVAAPSEPEPVPAAPAATPKDDSGGKGAARAAEDPTQE